MRSNFGLKLQNIARNCLTYMLDFIVTQRAKLTVKRANRNALETRARVLVDRTQASRPSKEGAGFVWKGLVLET